VKILVDMNLSPRIARALNALSEGDYPQVIHLSEKFSRNAADTLWLAALGQEGDWTVVSADRRIPRSAHERRAWSEARLTCFFLESGWLRLKMWDQAWKLVQRWPVIVETARTIQRGTAFSVPVTSSKLRVISVPRS